MRIYSQLPLHSPMFLRLRHSYHRRRWSWGGCVCTGSPSTVHQTQAESEREEKKRRGKYFLEFFVSAEGARTFLRTEKSYTLFIPLAVIRTVQLLLHYSNLNQYPIGERNRVEKKNKWNKYVETSGIVTHLYQDISDGCFHFTCVYSGHLT